MPTESIEAAARSGASEAERSGAGGSARSGAGGAPASGAGGSAPGGARGAAGTGASGAAPSMARGMWNRFWRWYERHYLLNVSVASGLFVLQLIHLYWLAASPIAMRLTGESFFNPSGAVQYAIFFVDYTEIPALMAVSLVYVNELRSGFAWRPLLFLAFLNSQWLHIFWITDQYVSNELSGRPTVSSLPGWLAWVAILIDYLELPVIYDTFRRAATTSRRAAR